MSGGTPAERSGKPRETIEYVGGLGDVRCFALAPSHPLSVRRGDDGHHERRRGGNFERREVDFLL